MQPSFGMLRAYMEPDTISLEDVSMTTLAPSMMSFSIESPLFRITMNPSSNSCFGISIAWAGSNFASSVNKASPFLRL